MILTSISCSSSVAPNPARSPQADPEFAVPDGTPDEIMKFVEKLKARKPKFANQQEAVTHAIKAQRAFIAAGDKILQQEVEETVAVEAAKLKLTALFMLAEGRVEDSPKEVLAAVVKLKQDQRPSVAKLGEMVWTPARIVSSPTMAAEERATFTEELFAAIATEKYSAESVSSVAHLGDTLAGAGQVQEAGALYDRLAKLASTSDDANFQRNEAVFRATGRRLRLPGGEFMLKGKTLTGAEIDWPSYRGKVVLIDYWATWCGPCVQELPNVKMNYSKYHDKGFEVIGISLDNSRATLEKFINQQQVPWPQLFDESQGTGWGHPMVKYYGINSVPAAILVDRDGKVVSMSARAEELATLLEKLLGKAD